MRIGDVTTIVTLLWREERRRVDWGLLEDLERGVLTSVLLGELTPAEGVFWIDQVLAAVTHRGRVLDNESLGDIGMTERQARWAKSKGAEVDTTKAWPEEEA